MLQLGGWRPRWHTALVLVSVLVVMTSVALSGAGLAPMALTTAAAVVGGTGFVLGVSASISAFLERDANADSDFWR